MAIAIHESHGGLPTTAVIRISLTMISVDLTRLSTVSVVSVTIDLG